jgi:hypothetical protein
MFLEATAWMDKYWADLFCFKIQLVLIGEVLYLTATYLVKVSIAFTLFRIVTARLHRYTIYVLLLVGAILTTIACFWALFLCNPVSYFWDRLDGSEGSCKSIRTLMAVHLVQASWTLISDLTLGLVIPGLVLWGSLMDTRTKVLVWFLLGFGSLYSSPIFLSLSPPPRLLGIALIKGHKLLTEITILAPQSPR